MKGSRSRTEPAVRDGAGGRRYERPFWRDLVLMAGLSAATLVLFSLIFPPRTIWPLAFVCLVPWVVAVCRVQRPWLVHWGSFALGLAFFLVNLSWLRPVTGLGFAALAFYLGLYWPLSAWALRTGRRARIAPVWSLPVVWVGGEFLRGWVMTGFPWLFLAHAFYRQLAFIQISDTVGAYGVTFLVALVNGLVVEWVLQLWRPGGREPRRLNALLGAAVTALALGGNLAYGRYRLEQAAFSEGPRVAVVQEDFPLLSTPPYGESRFVVFARYLALGAEAARHNPDLLVFPETVWSATQNIDFVEKPLQTADEMQEDTWLYGKLCHEATAAFARGEYAAVNEVIARFETLLNRARPEHGARVALPRLPAEGGPPVTLVVGSVALVVLPEAIHPKQKRFNSALVYDRDGTQRRQRYDKMHLVPFGEFVPFRDTSLLGIRLHGLYEFLNRLSPFSFGGTWEYSLWPGDAYTAFDLETGSGSYRFGIPICYEDVMPYVMRNFAWEDGRRRVDFLVNISNDGWFLHSAELPQHLAICVFRAVENRIGIARAVNTGISGFIDPNGRLYSLVEQDGRTHGPGVVGYRVDTVRLDRRGSCYGRLGDWFALVCTGGTAALWGGAIVTRWVFALRRRLDALREKLRRRRARVGGH